MASPALAPAVAVAAEVHKEKPFTREEKNILILCRETAHIHKSMYTETAEMYSTYYYVLNITLTILSTISSASVIYMFFRESHNLIDVVNGVSTIIIIVITAVNTLFNFEKNIEKNKHSCVHLEQLIVDINNILISSKEQLSSSTFILQMRQKTLSLACDYGQVANKVYTKYNRRLSLVEEKFNSISTSSGSNIKYTDTHNIFFRDSSKKLILHTVDTPSPMTQPSLRLTPSLKNIPRGPSFQNTTTILSGPPSSMSPNTSRERVAVLKEVKFENEEESTC